MSPLLRSAIAVVQGWTRLYTSGMAPEHRADRRAEIESDLWEFHEDARRRGASPAGIAIHMAARLVAGIPDDLLWRMEYEEEAVMIRRRTAWMTAAAVGGAACVAALWIFFAITSLVALPPLPDSVHIERVYLRAMPPPPPPPPPPPTPRGLRGVLDLRFVPAPPPPPPPPYR
jgi:hypothetical protein